MTDNYRVASVPLYVDTPSEVVFNFVLRGFRFECSVAFPYFSSVENVSFAEIDDC